MKHLKAILHAAAALVATLICPASTAAQPQSAAIEFNPQGRTLLYNKGDMGSHYWRIPALATTNTGRVIAIADRRNDSNQDLPNRIDLVMRTSDDAGKTWTDGRVIARADSVGGYGDAALGVHTPTGTIVCVAAHGNGVFESTPENYTRVVVMRSRDNGNTWSEPQDITTSLFSPQEGEAPVTAHAGFATSGRMLCTADGRLMFVLAARTSPKRWGPIECFVVSSADAGLTWEINPTSVDFNGNEAKLAQLADESLLLSVRNRFKGPRRVSRSFDGGATWTPLELEPQLTDPSCNGDIMFVSQREIERLMPGTTGFEQGLLLHSLADDPGQRRNVVVKASTDSGRTWHRVWNVCPTPSAYSALTLTHEGNLLCLTEENAADDNCFRLWLSAIPLTEIIGTLTAH